MRSCSVIVENTSLITKTVIPAEILPLAITFSNLIHHAIGLGILLIVLFWHQTVPISVFAILLYLPILILFAQGLSWLVAGLQVFLRDTIQALQIVMFLWLWFTPVVYSPDRVPVNLRYLLPLNPMAVVVTGYRNSLLNLPQPNPAEIATALAISFLTFTLGGLIFRQAKPAFADVL